jgi:hypothetical protein
LAPSARQTPDRDALEAQQQELLGEQLRKYDQSMAASAAFCDLLKNQIAVVEAQQRELDSSRPKTSSFNPDPALKSVHNELKSLYERLNEAEKDFKEITSARDRAIAEAQQQLNESMAQFWEKRLFPSTRPRPETLPRARNCKN